MASKTKEGTWRVSMRFGFKRISKTFPTKAMALDYESRVRLAKSAPEVPRSKLTFGEYAEIWLKGYSALEKEASSQIEDDWAIRLYIKPHLGGFRLTSLTAAELTGFKTMLKQRIDDGKLSPKSANNIMSCAKKIMRTAVAQSLRPSYPWDGVKKFRVPERDYKFWTVEEGQRFYEAARFRNQDMADMVLFALNTGLRLGEIRALKWDAIDLHAGVMAVKATYNQKLRTTYKRTKNFKMGRIPLNETARGVLERRKGKSYDGLLFEPASFRQPYGIFTRLQKRLKVVPLIRFHDLRHSFASNLVAAGVDIYTIQKLMRHSSLAMTERYAHLSPDFLGQAVEKIGGTDLVRATASE